ncbi:MAG: hypothetical protein RL660_16 [Bacteroidota bacterium]|jgi:uncharacterized membrane protein YheB (UPF0754 family)
MSIWLWLLPVISAFIGWFTNWIAIKMLFHPREPKRILGITFQGIFPKRQAVFAAKLGALVSKELINFNDFQASLTKPSVMAKAEAHLDTLLDNYLKTKLKEQMPLLSMFISEDTLGSLKNSIKQEFVKQLPGIIGNLGASLGDELDVEKIVQAKVSQFSSDKLEQLLNEILSTEFRFVEIIGGVLGFIIGLIQVLITYLAK